MVAYLVKTSNAIASSMAAHDVGIPLQDIMAVMVDMNARQIVLGVAEMTVKEYLIIHITEEVLESLPRLTKEEFYTL